MKPHSKLKTHNSKLFNIHNSNLCTDKCFDTQAWVVVTRHPCLCYCHFERKYGKCKLLSLTFRSSVKKLERILIDMILYQKYL